MLEKMVIGTAQFGLDYGVNSSSAKKMTQKDCDQLLDIAYANGIRLLDTAEAYGDAIEKIAHYHQTKAKFEIISKFLHPGDILKPLRQSLKRLSISSYHTVLAHKSQDLFFNAKVQHDLLEMKHSGETRYIGVSIYTNAEFSQAIDNEHVDVIQFPFNMLDNMAQRGDQMKRAKDTGKILHARSVYLQGMFLKEFPLPGRLRPLEKYINILKGICDQNKISLAALALEYAFSNPMIDNVIVGHHSDAQLLSNIETIKKFSGGAYLDEVGRIAVEEAELLNPRNW